MNDNSLMPFGKYKGTPIGKVPASYLDWLIGQDWIDQWPDVEQYIEDNKGIIEQELGE